MTARSDATPRSAWARSAVAGSAALLLAAACASPPDTGEASAAAVVPQPAAVPGTVDVVSADLQIDYQVQGEDLVLTFQLANNKTGWMAVAFHEFIFPADTIVVWYDPETGEAQAWDTYNPGIPTLEFFPAPASDTNAIFLTPDASPYDNKDNVELVSASSENGVTTIQVRRALVTEDIFDFQIEPDHQFYALVMFGDGESLSNGPESMGDPQSALQGVDIWIVEE